MSEEQVPSSFSSWVRRPEVLVALAAVVLSLCGLFVAIYETTLIRKHQRAAVWPSLMVGYSWKLTEEVMEIWVVNRGVGPARVRAAALEYRGKRMADWGELLRAIHGDEDAGVVERLAVYGLVNGFVYPANMREAATVLGIPTAEDGAAGEHARRLHQEIVIDGSVDVVVCYCSVYDECWLTRLQGTLAAVVGRETPGEASREVRACDGVPVSNF